MVYRKQYSPSKADDMMATGRKFGITPLSPYEKIKAQQEQIRTLQTLLTEERFKNAKLLVLADGLMDIIEKHDIPLSEMESERVA